MELDRNFCLQHVLFCFSFVAPYKNKYVHEIWISIIDSFTSVANKWTMSIKEEFSHMLQYALK